jgi:aminoglycoside phosphotransferase
MDPLQEASLLKELGASSIEQQAHIQDLWSGYGKLNRYQVYGAEFDSVIIKEIDLRAESKHPRGWNTNRSHLRKLKSYLVESKWYKDWAAKCSIHCRVPELLYLNKEDSKIILVLEDLDASGFPDRLEKIELSGIRSVLSWLAHFHATFLNEPPKGLWKEGSYWHLATRKEEWEAMEDGELKRKAKSIAEKLSNAKFQTIVHGDAKLANFCFSEDHKFVAAVDFQYVGGGCGMKDVAYLMSSCMDSKALFDYDQSLLDHYFKTLESALLKNASQVDFEALIKEWRELYFYAWADFNRFLKGWSPQHWKLHEYSHTMANEVLNSLV